MAWVRALLALALLGHASALSLHGSRGFLATDMRPEVVAVKLVSVEDEWSSFAESCSDSPPPCGTPEQFSESCATVVSAMVQGSSGTRRIVNEYMGDVCGATALEGWHKEECQSLADSMDKAMSADDYSNRESLNATTVCQNFWAQFSQRRQAVFAKAREEREAEEKKRQEEAAEELKKQDEEKKAEEAKAQADLAAAAKARAEEAKAKADEVAHELEEEKKHAEEEKKHAAEAAAQAQAEAKNATTAVAAAAPEAVAPATNVTAAEPANASVAAPRNATMTSI